MDSLTHLFGENVWPLVWTIAIVELILGIVLFSTGRARLIAWMVLLAALAGILLVAEWLWVTDRERVDAVVTDMARAVERHDVDGIVRHLAPDCRYGTSGRDAIASIAAGLFRTFDIHRVAISDRRTRIARVSRQATVEFLAVVHGRAAGNDLGPQPSRWELTLREDGSGQWQVTEITQLQAFGDTRQEIAPQGRLPLPMP